MIGARQIAPVPALSQSGSGAVIDPIDAGPIARLMFIGHGCVGCMIAQPCTIASASRTPSNDIIYVYLRSSEFTPDLLLCTFGEGVSSVTGIDQEIVEPCWAYLTYDPVTFEGTDFVIELST